MKKSQYAMNECGERVRAEDACFLAQHVCELCGARMLPVSETVFYYEYFVHDPDEPAAQNACPLSDDAEHDETDPR